jgi:hypothetical protein
MATYDELVQGLIDTFDSTTEFTTTDYLNAYTKSCRDTGWSYPNSDSYQQEWFEKRMLRHLFSFKTYRSIKNFDVPKAKLEQMFQHYRDMVKEFDEEFFEEKAGNPEKYGLDGGGQFGTVASSGFLRDPLTGRDLTYTEDNENGVLINGD